MPGSLAPRKIDAKGVNFVASSRPGMTNDGVASKFTVVVLAAQSSTATLRLTDGVVADQRRFRPDVPALPCSRRGMTAGFWLAFANSLTRRAHIHPTLSRYAKPHDPDRPV
jgi:hypothetical protein